jgi:hypothetical protein
MVNVSRMQVPCVIGAISWIITGTKKRCRFVATPPGNFFPEATFSGVKYRYNDSFISIIFTENYRDVATNLAKQESIKSR